MLRFSWAGTLMGASQLASLAGPRSGNGRAARAGGLDRVTWAAQGHLGELLKAAFQAGDDLQEDGLELLAGALSPRRWPRTAARLAGHSRDTLRIARPDREGALARRELQNKLEVYRLVKGVRRQLGHPAGGVPFDLEPYVNRAFETDDYRALWLIEGLGHDYAESALERGASPRGLLQGKAVAGLPPASLPMLHGGLGLTFAEHVLATLTPVSSAAAARRALERFVELCREGSQEGHLDSAIESLGLDARCFFPDLMPALERGLRALGDPVLRRFFWHGAGRALYFVPVNFIPGYGSLRHAVDMAEREAPGETSRHAALAGLGYAFTMVNMAQPEILESPLRDDDVRFRGTAFSDGAVAAMAMRHRITPGAAALRRLAGHRPASRSAEPWREVFGDPCRRAIRGSGEAGPESAAVWRDREAAEVYRSLPRARMVRE